MQQYGGMSDPAVVGPPQSVDIPPPMHAQMAYAGGYASQGTPTGNPFAANGLLAEQGMAGPPAPRPPRCRTSSLPRKRRHRR